VEWYNATLCILLLDLTSVFALLGHLIFFPHLRKIYVIKIIYACLNSSFKEQFKPKRADTITFSSICALKYVTLWG